MDQPFDKGQAIAAYTRLMQLTVAGAYQERNADGSYAEDGIEESLERLDLQAAAHGLRFRWQSKQVCWTLEPLSEDDKAIFAEALRGFAAQAQMKASQQDKPA